MKEFDVVIIGAGIGGCTAGIYCARGGLKVGIFDEKPGGQTAKAVYLENFPGFEKIKGFDLMKKVLKQVKKLGVKIIEEHIVEIEKKGKEFVIDEKYKAKSIIIASGAKHKELGVKGEGELYGKGVGYCAVCDGPIFNGEDVLVVGGGNSGVTNALFLAEFCKKVYLVEFFDKLNCSEIYKKDLEKSNIEVLLGWGVEEFKGKDFLEKVVLKNKKGKKKNIAVSGAFIYAGFVPGSEFSKLLKLETDKNGFLKVDKEQETNVKGVFACGDVCGKLMQAVWAAAEGAQAGLSAINYVRGNK